MSVTIQVNAQGLERLSRNWPEASRKAQRDAMRGVLFRLKNQLQAQFRAGIGLPPRDPLTPAEEVNGTNRALSALAPFISYLLDDLGGSVFYGRVGFSGEVQRRPQNRRKFELLFSGGTLTLDQKRRMAIAEKLVKRLGSRFQRQLQSIGLSQGRSRRWGTRFRRSVSLAGLMPKKETKELHWPERDWVRETVRARRSEIQGDFRVFYAAALRGLRWS